MIVKIKMCMAKKLHDSVDVNDRSRANKSILFTLNIKNNWITFNDCPRFIKLILIIINYYGSKAFRKILK
jgi:hypothetical protein